MTMMPVLMQQLAWLKLPEPVTEHRFHDTRRWRFDAAWPSRRLAVEVEGGGFVAGRHTRGKGLERDCEKYAEAAILGWTVIRVTPDQVKRGEAVQWIERWLKKGPTDD